MQYLRSLIDGITNILRGVLDFIGSIWGRIYKYVGSVVKPIWERINSYATAAYNAAVSFVMTIYAALVKAINSGLSALKQYAISLVASAVSSVKSFAQSLVNGVKNFVQQAIALANQVASWARGQVSALLAHISEIWRWVNDRGNAMYGIIGSWLKVFTTDNLSRFIYLVVNLFPSIFNFFKDPVHFVRLWLEPMLLDMIYWLLAYELGTKNANLPNKPKDYG
jgi:phage-related protein